MRYLDISLQDQRDAEKRLHAPREVLGHLSAMSVSGNDVSGSVFYAFPLVFAAAGEFPCTYFYLTTYFASRNILATLFVNGFPTPICIPAAPARARLYRPYKWIVCYLNQFVSALGSCYPPETTSTSCNFRGRCCLSLGQQRLFWMHWPPPQSLRPRPVPISARKSILFLSQQLC